jgi:quinone-modifying oxidoreductase subunit QmoB
MSKRVGVYICSGCSIGESLDLDRLARVAHEECKAPVCRVHPFLCGEEGLATIRKDVADQAVDALVIAACSPRMKTAAFTLDPRMPMDRVNLREHVAWAHPPKDEDSQALAEDYLRMGIVKAEKSEPLEPLANGISRTILVVGGGVAGIHAARAAADAGYDVVLVEKERELGGRLAHVELDFPTRAPYTELEETGLAAEIRKVGAHPKVQVRMLTRVVRTEGQPGAFAVTLESQGKQGTVTVGSIVVATGWRPYDPTRLGHLGYGKSPNVVTSDQFDAMIAAGAPVRPSDGKPAESVLFIQCAGSRDQNHLPYCSAVCCMKTLEQADRIHRRDAATKVYIIYRDIVTPGQSERYYARVQNHPATFLLKGDVAGVRNHGDKMAVEVKNTLLGEHVEVPADVVVLATGFVPNAPGPIETRNPADAPGGASGAQAQGQTGNGEAVAGKPWEPEPESILNLTYRQGPELPICRDGFPGSNFICFPYETLRTGIYTAGAVHAPMDGLTAAEDAAGAAMKAVQCVEMISRGQAVHPRAGDLSYPSFFLQRCTQCKRCTVECPFGAIDEDEKGTPKFNPNRCRRCGVCMGACPERIISFKNYSVDMIAGMIKAIEVPDEDEEKPRVLVFMCENDAYPALDMIGMKRRSYDPSVRVIPLRCLGSLNVVWIADALSRGIDGVMLIGCKYGEDYQCHFAKGSEIASRRLENVKETLQRLQLESERVEVLQLSLDEYAQLPETIDAFVDRVRELGPNPYKGF